MEAISRLRDTFVEYLSPKRRRTVGPTPSTPTDVRKLQQLSISDPQNKKRRRGSSIRKSSSPYPGNPRKRPRKAGEAENESSIIGPGDSVSQRDTSTEVLGFSETSNLEDDELAVDPGQQSADSVDYDDDDDQDADEELEVEEDYDNESGHEDVDFEDVEELEPEIQSEEEQDDELALETDEEEPSEPEISPDAKVEEYLARQAELALRKESIAKARRAGDWHPDELFLFERLTLRSFEELVPQCWKIDFRTLPEILFTEDHDRSLISYNNAPSGHGVKALQALLSLGVRVRDKIIVGLPTEKLIEQEIKRYNKWSEKDGGFFKKRFLPVITVVRARPSQSVDSISKSITTQMTFLAEKHREYLASPGHEGKIGETNANGREPPLLYGIIVARTITIFVTLDSANPNAKIRHLQHFDFKEKDMDVWNGFAIAIMIVCARNYIMSIADELDTDDTTQTDEDA